MAFIFDYNSWRTVPLSPEAGFFYAMPHNSIKINGETLEDIIFENLQTPEGISNLRQHGFIARDCEHTVILRQFNLSQYGVIDLLCIRFYRYEINIEIIELKVTPFDVAHLFQLGRYITGVKHLMSEMGILSHRYKVEGTLVVAGFDTTKQYVWLDEILGRYITVYDTEYDLEGIKFTIVLPFGWVKTSFEYVRLVDNDLRKILLAKYRESFRFYLRQPVDDLPF